jgi:hypothetical protein
MDVMAFEFPGREIIKQDPPLRKQYFPIRKVA